MDRVPDSLAAIFRGDFHKPAAPSCAYIARMKNYPKARKVGMCQLPFREWRWGDLEYGSIVIKPRAPRLHAWLAEQRVLQKTQERGQRWCPPRLLAEKWPGYTELRVTPVDDLKRYLNGALHCIEEMGVPRFIERFIDVPERYGALYEAWRSDT
jgi:hypothetical protein